MKDLGGRQEPVTEAVTEARLRHNETESEPTDRHPTPPAPSLPSPCSLSSSPSSQRGAKGEADARDAERERESSVVGRMSR